jgi:hypothetical protein
MIDLDPPPYQSTERDDLIAAFRAWLDDYYYGEIYAYNELAHKYGEPKRDYGETEKHVANLLHNLMYKDFLSTSHCGDCTAVPASCARCIAEDVYCIPSTVTWNKHEGWAAFNRQEK